MPKKSSTSGPRRTQEERSTATRRVILEATIDALVELGYADTSTTAIAERAGVSRGAQLHHYPTKAELVAAAVEHLAERISEELATDVERRRSGQGDGDLIHPVASSIDSLWRRYSSPLFQAWVELWVAARTDEHLRAVLAPTEKRFRNAMRTGLPDLFGPTPTGGIAEAWSLTFYLLQGMAFERALGMEDRGTRERREERALRAWKALVAPSGEQFPVEATG